MSTTKLQLTQKNGFTLIELSIVLVIIGLVVGGTLLAKDLIRAAELRAIIQQENGFEVAIKTFKGKYNALPGDMPNATDIWGAAHASYNTCKTTLGTDMQTCNGNGDGKISTRNDFTQFHEQYRVWQHLSNAGFIGGSYTGVSGPLGVNDHVIDQNAPAAKISGAGWTSYYTLVNLAMPSGPEYFTGLTYNFNTFYFGSKDLTGAGPGIGTMEGPILTPQEAYSLDLKMDDGRPGFGKVMAPSSGSTVSPNCTTSTDPNAATYNLTVSTIECALLFKFGE